MEIFQLDLIASVSSGRGDYYYEDKQEPASREDPHAAKITTARGGTIESAANAGG
jgi:hypothetical protein